MEIKNSKFCIIILVFLEFSLYAQNTSSAFYINHDNDTIHGEVINERWKNTPQSIQFRMNGVVDFELLNDYKFKVLVIDGFRRIRPAEVYYKNPSLFRQSIKEPPKSKKILFEDLIEGYFNLYVYRNGAKSEFYFAKENDTIKRLEHIYDINSGNPLPSKEYHLYRFQLWDLMRCIKTTKSEINDLSYNEKSLTKYFAELNSCMNFNFIDYNEVRKQYSKYPKLIVNARGGLNYSTFRIVNSSVSERNTKFDDQYKSRFGAELELLLPYNNYHFAMLLEFSYNRYSDEKDIVVIPGKTTKTKVDVKFLENSFGVRYYFKENDKQLELDHNYFVNASTVIGLDLGSEIKSERKGIIDAKYMPNVTVGLGIGYLYKNKLSLELRSNLPTNILNNVVAWKGSYWKNSIIIGYRIYFVN